MKDLKFYLNKALKENFALGSFNFSNMETLQGIVEGAIETNSPVIVSVSESALKYMGEYVVEMVQSAKKSNPNIFLHLDHGKSFEICKMAIEMGFDSVMIDGSALPFEKNIALTKKVCSLAHSSGVLVEGELGKIKGTEDKVSSASNLFTNPSEAKEFVNQTGVDMLAISIGTSHGVYKSNSNSLRFDILAEIEGLIPRIPLVLHGASSVSQEQIDQFIRSGGVLEKAGGIADDELKKAITKHNIVKVNTDTDIRLAFTTKIREFLASNPQVFDPRKYLSKARENVKKLVKDKIKNILQSENKIGRGG